MSLRIVRIAIMTNLRNGVIPPTQIVSTKMRVLCDVSGADEFRPDKHAERSSVSGQRSLHKAMVTQRQVQSANTTHVLSFPLSLYTVVIKKSYHRAEKYGVEADNDEIVRGCSSEMGLAATTTDERSTRREYAAGK